jgi:hypothetical protein
VLTVRVGVLPVVSTRATDLHGKGESDRPAAAINTLTDDIFLEMFYFCVPDPYEEDPVDHVSVWQGLVHVCRRWRQIIFASPRYLDLHLFCSSGMFFKENLSLWPEFSIYVECCSPEDEDDLLAALEHPDRVRYVELYMERRSMVEKVLGMLQVPFPVLTYLDISGSEREVLDLPDRLLGAAAPGLQDLCLGSISFPALPTLLLSTRDLVSLRLRSIPPTGYISPEAMAGSLVVLTKLRTLHIEFPNPIDSEPLCQQPRYLPMDPPVPAVLPALTEFRFNGDSEYLEDLLAQITMPQVEVVNIQYFKPEVEASQLSQFVGRTANLKFAQFRHAQLTFDFHNAYIGLHGPQVECQQAQFTLTIWDPEFNFPISSMVNVLGQLVALLSNVGELSIASEHLKNRTKSDSLRSYVGGNEWVPLLRPFTAVETLEVYGGLAAYVSSAFEWYLEDIGMEVLPALQFLCLDDYDDDVGMGTNEGFLSFRERSGHPVTTATRDEFNEIMANRRR